MKQVFKEQGEAISSIDYHHAGKYLVTASEDNSVRLYDAYSGVRKTVLNALKVSVVPWFSSPLCLTPLPSVRG